MSARDAKQNLEIRLRPEVCSVVVAYENAATRDFAIDLCDDLSRKFEGDLEFDFTWWGFKYLTDPQIAREAVNAAANADLIIVSVNHAQDFPFEVAEWFRQWSEQRLRSEGALVCVQASPLLENQPAPDDSLLRRIARHGNLDFLSLPEPTRRPFPLGDLPPTSGLANNGADHLRLLDERFHSSGWGINE